MRRIPLLVFLALATSAPAFAQANPETEIAVLAIPANMREGATVIKWKPDQTYDTLKTGTNGLVCWDRSGFPLQQPFSVECTSMGNIPRAAQNMKGEAVGDRAKAQALFDAMEKDGTRVKPEFGSVWYHLAGKDRESARSHMTIATPGATAQSMGIPDKRRDSGIWIMNAGTTTAHIMTPGE